MTDLCFYIPLLNDERKQGILATLKQELETKAANPNKLRYARALTSFSKFEFMFRNEPPNSTEELIAIIAPLLEHYHGFLKLDEKPEKGERKMADEIVLLIADILDTYMSKPGGIDQKEKLNLHLFKICLLELAFEYSNYNFDM